MRLDLFHKSFFSQNIIIWKGHTTPNPCLRKKTRKHIDLKNIAGRIPVSTRAMKTLNQPFLFQKYKKRNTNNAKYSYKQPIFS